MSKVITKESVAKVLTSIWTKLLQIENVKGNDNFFNLGGDSMGAVLILADVYAKFNVRISLEELLMNRTLSSQIDMIYAKIMRVQIDKIT